MNKPVMPEAGLTFMGLGPVAHGSKLFKPEQVEAHHAAWEAHCAAVEARLREVENENGRLREIATAMLPVMEAMRPLVLNLERLKDAAHSKDSR